MLRKIADLKKEMKDGIPLWMYQVSHELVTNL